MKFSDAILTRYTPTINSMTNKQWEYSNSIVLHGIEKVYANTRDTNYLKYIKTYVDAYVNGAGAITGLAPTLDKIHPGILCLFLYQETGLTRYKTAATNIRNYILATTNFAKTPDGGFWHKNIGYDNIMMLDGIYMAHPFLAKYGQMFKDDSAMNTACRQTLLLASHTYDSSLHLAKHAWNYYHSSTWSDPVTGASSEVWSRAMGWYAMAIVDILQYLPSTHQDYKKMRDLLDSLAIGIKNTQDPASGLWYQVMDKKDSAGNYLESSGSGMLIYALKKAVDNEWIDTSYLSVCRKGWEGLKTKIATYTDGRPQITSFAPAMSVQNNYTAYVSSPYLPVNCPSPPVSTQHPHGYCGLLMAASAMEFPITTYTFIGDGDWNVAANWEANKIPPDTLPKCEAIVIDPVTNGQCLLPGVQHISTGARLTVKKDKKFVISGNLIIQ
ncbi:glycoside hydrolase family 88/105 protein [Ferruginibacter lapsinanis]|uniref:glycoside hydrolase family 88/105 protein n=1 Tax=Ferruginibacter lapsinanis TaxID=563172 RepID=UPI001E5C16E0|nr:glycoside hydrolase family 88 protein [Ferruginibacter lapsinanis]